MDVADAPVRVHDAVERHAPQFEDVDFLTVSLRDGMIGVGQSDEWDVFFRPIFFERLRVVGSDRQNLRAAGKEIVIAVSHARQLRAAMRSKKAAQEGEDNGFLSAKTRKSDAVSVYVFEFKIGGKFAGGN